MSLTSKTMWDEWKTLYLPWQKTKSYDDWSWIQYGMPTIPTYKPCEDYKRFKMLMTLGKNYDAKPNAPGMVSKAYVNRILSLWKVKHYPSRM